MPAARTTAGLTIRPASIAAAVAVVALTLLALRILEASHRVLGWAAMAIAIAGILSPVVHRLSSRVPRALAILTVVLMAFASVGLVGFGVANDVTTQMATIQREAPVVAERVESSRRFGDAASTLRLSERVAGFADEVPDRLRGGTPAEALRSATTRGLAMLAVTVLSLFFVLHGAKLVNGAIAQLPMERRAGATRVAQAVRRRAFGYAGGSLAMAAAAGLSAFVVALATGVPGPAALGLWVALWNIVPILGTVIGAAPLVGFAAAASVPKGLAAAAFFVAYQAVEAVVVQRRIEQRTVRIGPFLTVAAGFGGLELYGLAGALLGVLAVAIAVTVVDEVARSGVPVAAGEGRPDRMEQTSKHSARMDEDMQKDTRGGAEAREALHADDDRPDVVQAQQGVMDDHDAARRAELARSIEPHVFPARPAQLLESAQGQFAADWVLDALSKAPDQTYDNLQELWRALGGPVEEKRA